jgi:hypothetical protein
MKYFRINRNELKILKEVCGNTFETFSSDNEFILLSEELNKTIIISIPRKKIVGKNKEGVYEYFALNISEYPFNYTNRQYNNIGNILVKAVIIYKKQFIKENILGGVIGECYADCGILFAQKKLNDILIYTNPTNSINSMISVEQEIDNIMNLMQSGFISRKTICKTKA